MHRLNIMTRLFDEESNIDLFETETENEINYKSNCIINNNFETLKNYYDLLPNNEEKIKHCQYFLDFKNDEIKAIKRDIIVELGVDDACAYVSEDRLNYYFKISKFFYKIDREFITDIFYSIAKKVIENYLFEKRNIPKKYVLKIINEYFNTYYKDDDENVINQLFIFDDYEDSNFNKHSDMDETNEKNTINEKRKNFIIKSIKKINKNYFNRDLFR